MIKALIKIILFTCHAQENLATDSLHFNLVRYTVKNNKLDTTSGRILLECLFKKTPELSLWRFVKVRQKQVLCFVDRNGTNPFFSNGYSPIDERIGKQYALYDAQRTSANTNSLQGKILRIHLEKDRTYTIPKRKSFEPGLPSHPGQKYI